MTTQEINDIIFKEIENKKAGLVAADIENINDGFHSFKELYDFRKAYNAALFIEWARQNKYYVHKSKRHYTGELCFDGSQFIVIAVLPFGQISNHYFMEDWELFPIRETPKALFPYDGHMSRDVYERIINSIKFGL